MRGCRTVLTALALVPLILVSCSKRAERTPRVTTGGDYGPVAKDQLRGEQTCRATGTSGAKFIWAFSEDRFEIKPDGGAIPREVLETILGPGSVANAVEGKWELADGTLTLSEIHADSKGGYADVQLKPFRTPVVRVHFGETQYVLGPRR